MRRLLGLIPAFLILLGSVDSPAGEPGVTIPPELVLEPFTFDKDDELITIPVRIAGKDHRFVLDTGASLSSFDKSLTLGEPLERTTVHTAGDDVVLPLHRAPEATVGSLDFKVDGPVWSHDFTQVREASGMLIEGMVGMDFLGQHIIHIDFDRDELLFLRSASSIGRERVPIYCKPGRIPWVGGSVAGSETIFFMIDTGGIGHDSGSLNRGIVESLSRGGALRKVGMSGVETIGGASIYPISQGDTLTLGPLGRFPVDHPVFGQTQSMSVLGLGYWSRFSVTFDFPGRTAYLIEGANFKRPDAWNVMGMGLIRRGEAILIHGVIEGTPADESGLKAGDRVIKIGDLVADRAPFSRVRAKLREKTRTEFVVVRDSKELKIVVDPTR